MPVPKDDLGESELERRFKESQERYEDTIEKQRKQLKVEADKVKEIAIKK
mgnify:CR=1 FL=1